MTVPGCYDETRELLALHYGTKRGYAVANETLHSAMIPWIVSVRYSYDGLADFKTQREVPVGDSGLVRIVEDYYPPIVVRGSRLYLSLFGAAVALDDPPLFVHERSAAR